MKIIEERLKKIEGLSLKSGAHSPNSTFCVMEAVAYIAGEPWSDHPECTCPVITAFMVNWNDSLPTDADRDRLLKPLIPRLVGTRNKSLEENARSCALIGWCVPIHQRGYDWLAWSSKLNPSNSYQKSQA